ncbi:MAG: hypothetical protein AB8B73_04050 [Ekhidna sp.]
MSVKASSFKQWCTDNISPQSWTRICLKNVDELRDKGYTLKEMEDLTPDVDLDDEILESLNNALNALYDMKVAEAELLAV